MSHFSPRGEIDVGKIRILLGVVGYNVTLTGMLIKAVATKGKNGAICGYALQTFWVGLSERLSSREGNMFQS